MAPPSLSPRPTKLPIHHPKQRLQHLLRSRQQKEFRGSLLPETDIQRVGLSRLSGELGGIPRKTGWDGGIVGEL